MPFKWPYRNKRFQSIRILAIEIELVSDLVVDSTFLQPVNLVPDMSCLIDVKQAKRAAVIGEEFWLTGLDNYNIKNVSPVITYQVFHPLISEQWRGGKFNRETLFNHFLLSNIYSHESEGTVRD